MIHETTFTYYALSIKGGFYSEIGQIVDDIGDAQLFKTPEAAKSFRKVHDPKHYVTESTLLLVQVLVSEVDYDAD